VRRRRDLPGDHVQLAASVDDGHRERAAGHVDPRPLDVQHVLADLGRVVSAADRTVARLVLGHLHAERPYTPQYRPHSILRYSAGSRAGLQPASELDSVREFGLSVAIHLASSSRTSSRDGRRPAANRSVTRFELSQHVEIARTCRRQVENQVCEQPASWIAGQRNGIWSNSITLSSSLAGHRPAREPAGKSARKPGRELDSVMEFCLFHAFNNHSRRPVADLLVGWSLRNPGDGLGVPQILQSRNRPIFFARSVFNFVLKPFT